MPRVPIYRDPQPLATIRRASRRRLIIGALGGTAVLALTGATLGHGFAVVPTAASIVFGTGGGPQSLVPNLLVMLNGSHAPGPVDVGAEGIGVSAAELIASDHLGSDSRAGGSARDASITGASAFTSTSGAEIDAMEADDVLEDTCDECDHAGGPEGEEADQTGNSGALAASESMPPITPAVAAPRIIQAAARGAAHPERRARDTAEPGPTHDPDDDHRGRANQHQGRAADPDEDRRVRTDEVQRDHGVNAQRTRRGRADRDDDAKKEGEAPFQDEDRRGDDRDDDRRATGRGSDGRLGGGDRGLGRDFRRDQERDREDERDRRGGDGRRPQTSTAGTSGAGGSWSSGSSGSGGRRSGR